MQTCSDCDRAYDPRTARSGYVAGLCDECWQQRARAEAERRRAGSAPVREKLGQFVRGSIPDDALSLIGLAHWRTPKQVIREHLHLAFLGVLLSVLLGEERHVGILAANGSDLFVADLGVTTARGEDTTLEGLNPARRPSSVRSFPLSALTVVSHPERPGTVVIRGALRLTATFPASIGGGNALMADEIAAAISAART